MLRRPQKKLRRWPRRPQGEMYVGQNTNRRRSTMPLGSCPASRQFPVHPTRTRRRPLGGCARPAAARGSSELARSTHARGAGAPQRIRPRAMKPSGPTTSQSRDMAERQGFEPWVNLRSQRLSRPPYSTALAPLRVGGVQAGSRVLRRWRRARESNPHEFALGGFQIHCLTS